MSRSTLIAVALLCAAFSGCETTPSASSSERAAMMEAIRNEPPGNYFVGRRYYKKDYKMWGFVRRPGQTWKDAQFVMLNEQQKLAPDRERGTLGVDNNHEYRLQGYYSGGTVYEPASDRFYPEFVLTGYELRSTNPPMIYKYKSQLIPSERILVPPY